MGQNGDELPRNGPQCLCEIFFCWPIGHYNVECIIMYGCTMKDGRCIAGCKLRRIHVIGRYVHGVGKQLYMTRRLAAPPPPPPRCIEKTPASLLVRRL